MSAADLRIVSLLPSATEIVAALGLGDRLVGRSHECDYPAAVAALPVCTRPRLALDGSSAEIDAQISDFAGQALSLYELDMDALSAARPTHIVTQDQCEVCAVSLKDVEAALAKDLQGPVEIVSLSPMRLGEVWASIRQAGRALGTDADDFCRSLTGRIARIAAGGMDMPGSPPSVATIEWCDPLMAAGNWLPELVAIAGGNNLLGDAGAHSPKFEFADLCNADPDIIVFMPCGYDLAKTAAQAEDLVDDPAWAALSAVANGQVYAVDGSAYFNRPGPRLVESAEILAEICHPDLYQFGHEGTGWRRLAASAEKK
ncbi:MAG: cobalamin-binding protein [Rhodospirillaceae bacterium]|jgi:iron complex transport system substrate-binding protein|nr:cobalamin-binding protein [Rhodospirillaceae bacterium]MBT4428309.1 cobalamin-binding protein [Rhodospirillaceae bacterium]MBT5778665.1 cobalamin-binding protein [Rhodospirillaceae bacterium]MBT6828378.1 cobalamin-binding protein [Rhodospirillaceae bacterium]